jgi:hypothetical protein
MMVWMPGQRVSQFPGAAILGVVNWDDGKEGTDIHVSHMVALINVKFLRSSGAYIIGP